MTPKLYKQKTKPFRFGVLDMPKYRINKAVDQFIYLLKWVLIGFVLFVATTIYKSCEYKNSEQLKMEKGL